MTKSTSARAVADTDEGAILAAVEVEASPEGVFRALTAPDEVLRWWGANDVYRTTSWVADLRPGGAWRADGSAADGAPFSVSGEYFVVEPPAKLVQSWKSHWDAGHTTTVTYRFEGGSDVTRLTLRHDGFKGRPDVCRMHSDGWALVLQWLEQHFDHKSESNPSRFFLFRLIAPRPTFPNDATDVESAAMNQHFAFWERHAQSGTAIAYGPVNDPKGVWGLAIVRVADEDAARALEAGDPIIRSGLGFHYEILPMLKVLVHD